MKKQYVLNQETKKIELQFTKEEYKTLSMEDKKLLQRAYLFSGKRQAWVSRSTNNHYSAIHTAQKLGFIDGGKVGERLSFAEEVERESEKAFSRMERFEHRADNANIKAESLQKDWNEASKDWSYVTQPIIVGHSGSQRFAKQRQRVLDRYSKGFDEYRKSEYFKERAKMAQEVANMSKFQNRSYLSNRIEDCNKKIRSYERSLVKATENNKEERIQSLLEEMEYEIDKLAYLHNKLDDLGGVFNKDNFKVGYEVKIDNSWGKVVKVNPKKVEVLFPWVTYSLSYPYEKVQDMKIPSDWKEEKKEVVNPFEVGDIVTYTSIGGYKIISAFQVVKKTDKSVSLQQINVIDNVPQFNDFLSDKQQRRSVKQNFAKVYVVNYGDWCLYKYNKIS